MPNPTQDQALQIAQAFSGFATTVENYRFDHSSALSDLQQANLRNVETWLRATSNNFVDMGINLALDDVQDALQGLGAITTKLNEDLKTLADINKAFQVIGVLLQVGTAFATGNPAGIATALEGAVTKLTTLGAAAPAQDNKVSGATGSK
ncbi:MAG: hypothetical protein ABSG56_06805 [Bryobacteraceae bacterium]|jgi:hypothetical protein